MSKLDREMLIEWLTIRTTDSKAHWESQSDEIIELNYRKFLEGVDNE